MIYLRKLRTNQPQGPIQVDWGNPLARGLSAAFDLQSSRDLITQATPSVNTSIQIIKNQKVGRAFSAGTNTQFPHRSNFALTGVMTALVLMDVNALSGYTPIITKQATSTTYNIYELRASTEFGGAMALVEGRLTDYAVWETASPVISAGFSGVVGFTRNANTVTGERNFYANGKKFSSTITRSMTGNITDDGLSPVYLGTRQDAVTKLNGNIYLAVLWSRVLSDNEIASFSANPWQIFAPSYSMLLASGAAPPASTIYEFNSLNRGVGRGIARGIA